MPAFNESILYVIFFLAYLLVNLYLFMNLLLAVIFSNYKQHLQVKKIFLFIIKFLLIQEEQQLIHKRQLDSFMIIFERLTSVNSPRHISYETYTRLIRAMKADITENKIDAYWATLDVVNKEDGLNLKQFNELLFNLNFDLRQRSGDQTTIQKKCPSIYNSKPSRVILDFVDTA